MGDHALNVRGKSRNQPDDGGKQDECSLALAQSPALPRCEGTANVDPASSHNAAKRRISLSVKPFHARRSAKSAAPDPTSMPYWRSNLSSSAMRFTQS